MDDEGREYYNKLLTFTCGISLDVLHLYFEIKILDKEEFFLFLDRCKHVLFHALHPAVSCCECSNEPIPLSQKPPRLYSKQFNLLFDIENSTLQSHHNRTIQHCSCKYSASRSVKVDSLDISLVYAIVNICCPSIHGNPHWIKNVKDTRNFLAHKCDCRITKDEYDTWLPVVENATLDLAKVVCSKLCKMTQQLISDFKKDKLSSNRVKDILASSNDDVCKRLEFFMRNLVTQVMSRDMIDLFKKIKDELLIDFNELVFEVKTHISEKLESLNITEESIETECATNTPQTAQPQSTQSNNEKSIETECATNTPQTAQPAQPQSTQSNNEKKRIVEWKLATPDTWNVSEMKKALQNVSCLIKQWFEIEFVYIGSLVIRTIIPEHILSNYDDFKSAVRSFLAKIVEVCQLDTDTPTVVKVDLNIFTEIPPRTTDDISTSNDLQRELNIKTGKDSEMLWENSDICSTVTSETADDTASDTQGSFDENMQKFYRCRELILKLTDTLGKEQDVENHNRIEKWRKQLKELEGKCSIPSLTVGVVGTTGTGKSSLLNAMIDEYNVLPTSGTQACTAVVVKIQNNYKNDLYEADIEFLSTEEWNYELQLLKKDLTDKNGKMKKKMNPSPESEAGVAYLKITAVYGEFDSFEDLEKQTKVTSHLGKTETIKSEWASEFRNKVDEFIQTTTTKTGGQFWPIIKSVSIRIPRCGVCSSGITLVDLPGVGDANAARDKIAKEYLQNCSVILIATEISRACSSKTAKHLFDENFRRQLLMDGQYGNIVFVCTKNDVLTPTELIRELKLEDETDHLRKDLNAMNTRVKELNKEIKHLNIDRSKCVDEREQLSHAMEASDGKLKLELSRENKELSLKKQDKQNEIESLEAKKNKLEINLTIKHKTMNLICAKARTEFVSKEIKKDFKAGIKEMKRKAEMTQEEIEEDEEDSDDDDGDDDSHLTNSCENLKVFCVSSSEYQKLKSKQMDDGPPKVFDSEEDTGIPDVRQFVQKIAEQKEKEATKRLIQNLALFIYDIKDYLTKNEITCKKDRTTVQSAVTNFSSGLKKKLSRGGVLDQLSKTLSQEINSIAILLEKGVEMAEDCAVTTCLQWEAPVDKDNNRGGLSYKTYDATIRRDGVYNSRAVGNINFNEDLVAPLISSITVVWYNYFSSELWDILDKYKWEIQQLYMTFTNTLCKELQSLNLSMTDLKRTRNLHDLVVEYKLTEMIFDLKKVVENRQRNINRMFTPIIKERLMETYDKCKKEKGKGVFNRIKQKLKEGVDHNKCTMFKEASSIVQSQLQQLMKEVISKIGEVCQKICESSSTAYEPFWDFSEASKQLKTTLYDDISEAALIISDLCSRTGVDLPIKTDQDASPVVKQEAELVPGSEMKIRIKTESGISPRIKAEPGVSPQVKVEPGISPTVSPLKMENTSKEHQQSYPDMLSKKNIWSLGKHQSSLSKQQTPSGMGKDGLTDAASLVPEVKVKTELSDYSTPPKRRKIRKGEEVVITKPDSGSCDDQNLQSEEIAATLTFTDTESD